MYYLSALRLHRLYTPTRRLSTMSEGFVRMNIYKDAEKGPKEMADEEYPQWLWHINDPEPTLEELHREASILFHKGGYDHVLDSMPQDRLVRLFRLDSRVRLRTENSIRKGGKIR